MRQSMWGLFVVITALVFPALKNVLADEPLAGAFSEHGAKGTFVVFDPVHATLIEYHSARAQQRFVPASTFKIVNTLIGLRNGVVEHVDVILPYGGKPQPYPEWEHDMSLRNAIRISNVPIYQELARRIGLQEMKAALKTFGYGNEEVGDVVDRFWLDGPLKISAVEQVDFLRRMLADELGLSKEVIHAVKEITLLESSPDYLLHGKTGWDFAGKIGWFIGWVEKDGVNYPFALNMDVTDKNQLPVRIALAKECLRQLGILPLDQKP